MSATGLHVFDKTVRTTNLWLGRSPLSKPVQSLWPENATAPDVQVIEQTLERTEP